MEGRCFHTTVHSDSDALLVSCVVSRSTSVMELPALRFLIGSVRSAELGIASKCSTITKVSASDSLSDDSSSTGAGPATTSYSDSELVSPAVFELSDTKDALLLGSGCSLRETFSPSFASRLFFPW